MNFDDIKRRATTEQAVRQQFYDRLEKAGFHRCEELPDTDRAIITAGSKCDFGFTTHLFLCDGWVGISAYDIEYWVYPEELSTADYDRIRTQITYPDSITFERWEKEQNAKQ